MTNLFKFILIAFLMSSAAFAEYSDSGQLRELRKMTGEMKLLLDQKRAEEVAKICTDGEVAPDGSISYLDHSEVCVQLRALVQERPVPVDFHFGILPAK